jgi:hypothetical protein
VGWSAHRTGATAWGSSDSFGAAAGPAKAECGRLEAGAAGGAERRFPLPERARRVGGLWCAHQELQQGPAGHPEARVGGALGAVKGDRKRQAAGGGEAAGVGAKACGSGDDGRVIEGPVERRVEGRKDGDQAWRGALEGGFFGLCGKDEMLLRPQCVLIRASCARAPAPGGPRSRSRSRLTSGQNSGRTRV